LAPELRTTGRPPSANGASSLHLFWRVPPGVEVVEASVTLVVPELPRVDALYFWALQVSLPGAGGVHLGLQWGADPPRQRRHVNFGGYGPGGELGGSESPLSSSFSNPNTRDFDWEPGRPYRLAVRRGPQGWAGWVDDTLVRELQAPDGLLRDPMVWSEVFAACDDPPAEVRWIDPEVVPRSGDRISVREATTNYQHRRDGGCDNTSSRVDGDAFVQTTSVARETPQGAALRLG
jgi:hypothetical protein